MYNDLVMTEDFSFLMTVAKLYDDGYSIGEIAQKLKKKSDMSTMQLFV